jgi:sporulation protein YlmC with PRC-barrel domain
MRLEIGNRVRCTDGVYGELADIVIDPLEKRVTHLVVQPEQGEGEARLVPIQLAKGRDDEQREIELECTLDEAQGFESVREAAYLRLGESPPRTPTGTSASRTSLRCRTTPVSTKARIRARSTPT